MNIRLNRVQAEGGRFATKPLAQLVLQSRSVYGRGVFDERNAAVKKMSASVIQTAKSQGCKIGICGQAPIDYAEFARFLVEQGIDTISLTPDVIAKTTVANPDLEKLLGKI